MPTPTKPVIVLENEKKSHRTKAELDERKKAEEALATRTAIKERPEVKKSPAAHREFLRLRKLLAVIQKNDALSEGVINRYCQLTAECLDFEEKRERFYQNIDKAEQLYEEYEGEIKAIDYMRTLSSLENSVVQLDKQIQAKRKMLLDIEKECLMTIASAMRSIPKKPADKEDEDPMAALLNKRRSG